MKYRVGSLMAITLAVAGLASGTALANNRAPVDEIKVEDTQPQQQASSQQQGEMFYQMQLLQEEVRQLRGMLEELSYELNQLKQRQMDDYMDLDRRVSGINRGPQQGSTAPEAAAPVGGLATGAVGALALPVSGEAEKDAYSAAYQLLRDKQVDQAAVAFQAHIDRYPSGQYTANAHYWLGEIHLLKTQLEPARQSFAMVVNNFPTSRKAPDAAFKLGRVYHQMGDNAKAKELLQKVASGNTKAGRLARQYLESNFQ